jgi:hypothetical protein
MALITDPDLLTQSTQGSAGTPDGNVFIDTSTETIELIIQGSLDNDGVTLKALYSFLKEEWRADADLIKFDFPMTPITDEQMQIGVSSRNNGWNWLNTTTRKLIRTGGWQEVSDTGVVLSEWAGIISLGTLTGGTQPYYEVISGTPTDFTYAGPVNEAVEVYSAPSQSNFDYRSLFNVFAREQGDVYAGSTLAQIGVATMTYQVYRFPLSTAADAKIVATDNDIETLAPYTGMSITYFDTPQSRTIGASDFDFGIIIDGNNGTAEEIYEFVQYQLRQNSDIDAGSPGTVNGQTADLLLQFVGDTLFTRSATNPNGGGTGVFIDNYQAADVNRLVFTDNLGTERVFPFTATLTLNFSATLQADPDAKYWVFFTNDDAGDNTGRDFNTPDAILVEDATTGSPANIPMTGDVGGQPFVQLTYAYDTNIQRGAASAETDAPVTAVAIGLGDAQYVLATGTIARSNANTIALVAAQERNYDNPA